MAGENIFGPYAAEPSMQTAKGLARLANPLRDNGLRLTVLVLCVLRVASRFSTLAREYFQP